MMTRNELLAIPKVELHRHLELTLRPSTLRELAPQVGIEVPKAEDDPGDVKLKEQLFITHPMDDLESVLKRFLASQAVLHSEEVLARITYEAIEDAAREGIRILELRYAPTFINQAQRAGTFESIHRGIMTGAKLAGHLPVAVGFIATLQRILPPAEGARVVDFVIDHKDDFVGIDLADNEVGFEPKIFETHFMKAKKAGLHLTVHAGEASVPEAPEFVRSAIDLLGAERIGHGVQIYRSPEMMEYVREKNVALELCPTSNWLTGVVQKVGDHPFRMLMEAGVPVTINSDDPGIFDIDLTNEYRVLNEFQNFTREEFDRVNDTAAAFSFIPLERRQKHWPRAIKPVIQ